MMNSTFITWYPTCRRSDTLSIELGGVSRLIHYLKFKKPIYAPFKYMLQAIATWRHLLGDKPDVVFVASPPTIAVITVWIYARLFRRKYVIDAHTGMFDDPRWTWLEPVHRYLTRNAEVTIVTNDFLKGNVEDWGGRAFVIGDVPVRFPSAPLAELGNGPNVVVVNTFSLDEPLDEILVAASQLSNVSFHITGDVQHARRKNEEKLPDNARFTGWLSEIEYVSLLKAADVVMCLTTHDYTMQRGAYEAMMLEKPLITSDWPILRSTFTRGTVLVDNSPATISAAVESCINDATSLSNEMKMLATERVDYFGHKIMELKAILQLDGEPQKQLSKTS